MPSKKEVSPATKKMMKVSKLNSWKPKDSSQVFVDADGKLFVCYFDRIFNMPDNYNRFIIGKASYENQLETIIKYINFFINEYDLDKELPTAYLKLKFTIDKAKTFDGSALQGFIDYIYEVLFTVTMVDKIKRLVEENYLDDIETTEPDKKKYLKSEKKHLESLEFTNQHVKVLLAISFGIKIMSPVMFHWIRLNGVTISKESDTIYKFYERLFHIFGFGTDYDIYYENGDLYQEEIPKDQVIEHIKSEKLVGIRDGYNFKYPFKMSVVDSSKKGSKRKVENMYYYPTRINMYNKLYVYVKAKVLESNASNSPIFSQREIFGIDIFSVINSFTKRVIISENMVKYKFNERWNPKLGKYEDNIIGFNKTIIKFQLNYFLKEQYTLTPTELTITKNADGLSGVDKLLMTQDKIDEGVVTVSDINVEMTTKRLEKMIDIKIEEGEIEYYKKYFIPSDFQIQLFTAYLSKEFGSTRDLNLLSRDSYIHLLLLIKKKLLMELGYQYDKYGELHCACLPYILTGNLSEKVNNRIIRNNKFITKVEQSYMYHDLVNNKYRLLEMIKPGYIMGLLSTAVNTRFTYCVFEYPELLGEEIVYPEEKICDEMLIFLNNI